MFNKRGKEDDKKNETERLNDLEEKYNLLLQVVANNAQGLDRISQAVELQTGTLDNLVINSENQNELLQEVANSLNQLNNTQGERNDILQSLEDKIDSEDEDD